MRFVPDIDLTSGAMAKHRVSSKEEGGGSAKNRDIRRSRWETKARVYPRGSYCLNPHTEAAQWLCSNFHILLESNNVTTRRRGNPTARRNHERPQPARRRYYLTPPIYHVSAQSEQAASPPPRLDPRFDRGNNDRMERTMGRGWKRYCLAPCRGKSTFDSAVTPDPRLTPPRLLPSRRKPVYDHPSACTPTVPGFSVRRIRGANYTGRVARFTRESPRGKRLA